MAARSLSIFLKRVHLVHPVLDGRQKPSSVPKISSSHNDERNGWTGVMKECVAVSEWMRVRQIYSSCNPGRWTKRESNRKCLCVSVYFPSCAIDRCYSDSIEFYVAYILLLLGAATDQLGNTSSRMITEVKQHWARLVLGWETVQVLPECCC